MKKLLTLFFAAAILVCFAACTVKITPGPEAKGSEPAATETKGAEDTGAQSAAPADRTDFGLLMINSEPVVIDAKNCFTSGGVALICDATDTYTFKSSSEEVVWTVYILDEPFNDAARFLSQSFTAALEGDGTLEIEADKYVYICCSVNTFTAEAPSDATLTIDIA